MDEAALLKKYKLETLSGANLSGADLSRVDLHKVDLCGADLSGANLCGAYLYRADLSGANLSGVNLCGANLSGASLANTNLSGADLSGGDLSWVRPSGANLSGANLSRVNLSGADLSGANLLGVLGLASMQEEMAMLVLLREAIKQESFEFDMDDWHREANFDESYFTGFLETCGTAHCGAGFCQVELAKRRNPIALVSAKVAGSYAIPSMARLFYREKVEFLGYLDDLVSGKEPLLQR